MTTATSCPDGADGADAVDGAAGVDDVETVRYAADGARVLEEAC
ncbi:hypothetical protein [Streptomyces sp. NPDC006285]